MRYSPTARREATTRCLGWIEETYRIEASLEGLRLDLADRYREVRECITTDTDRMVPDDAVRYCDNVFQVHCSGLDLLTEIGEARVERCEAALGEEVTREAAWRTCGQHRIFEAHGALPESETAESCRQALEACREGSAAAGS